MANNFRVGVIGVGNMGQKHVQAFSDLQETTLIAVCEIDKEKGKKFSQEYGVKFYSELKEMLEKENLDLISVCVPTNLHYQVTSECISNGLNIILEKPICNNLKDAEKIIQLAEEKNVNLLVGHLERFNPAILKAKEIIEQDKLGKIKEVKAKRYGAPPVDIKGNSVAVDLAIHDIDLVNFLFQKTPINVNVQENKGSLNQQSTHFLLDYNSLVANIKACWSHDLEKVREIKIIGSEGILEINCATRKIKLIKKGEEVELDTLEKDPLREQIKYFLKQINQGIKVDSKFALEALAIALHPVKEGVGV